ncbi:hypothetical protein, partial [Bradyrhizobium liaoningense]|uniref:hypothetical protein n=1 Tax=Bradyrhizobium liaoningense TaxID=43992 RepID=UPI001BACB60E
MSDTYQAVYDAVRSKISGGDIGSAVESAVRDAGIGDQVHSCRLAVENALAYYVDPSVLYRPKLSVDGNQWCALYGENLQDGIAGFGDSVELAMRDFNKNWNAKLSVRAGPGCLDSAPLDLSGFLPGYAERGA